jgi:2-amino-4-hydroxy-6-hydroxymethyldihydropteridine diphosphokinase
MNKLEKIYLHTGSNLGSKKKLLKRARQLIDKNIGRITAQSDLFETEAWGMTDQPNFVNQALEIVTDLSPEQVMDRILNIELKMGRVRNQKWAPRLIDIDIIFYGNRVIKTENLIIPHPFMHKRNFVLIPLLEIAENYIHPELKMTVRELYNYSKDLLKVKAHRVK